MFHVLFEVLAVPYMSPQHPKRRASLQGTIKLACALVQVTAATVILQTRLEVTGHFTRQDVYTVTT